MGIYRMRMEAAAEPAAAVQTPDEIGVDLDQVEKAIAGPDGIAAHADEVEAAEEGMIGDPLEEAGMIMFESEYNYNQIMTAIGVAELREASMGREMVYEAADIKGFFAKVKEMLKKMFEAVTKAVRTVMAKLDVAMRLDKKLVKDHANDIKEGHKKGLAKAIPGYKFDGFEKVFEELKKADAKESEDLSDVSKALDDLKANKNVDSVKEDIKNYNTFLAEMLQDHGVKSLSEFAKSIREKLFGQKVDAIDKEIKPEEIIAILDSDREASAVKKYYSELKAGYNKSLKQIAAWEKAISGAEYGDNTTLAFALCEAATRVIKDSKNYDNTCCAALLAAARAKRTQARKLAYAFVRANGKKVKEEDGEPAPKNEGATGVFAGIQLL